MGEMQAMLMALQRAVMPEKYNKHEHGPSRRWNSDGFLIPAIVYQAVMIGLFFGFTEYNNVFNSSGNLGDANRVASMYTIYSGIAIMIIIGFGFLMTFLKRYQWSALGFNFLITCCCFEWGILCQGFWHQVHLGSYHRIQVSVMYLIEGMFAGGTVMITFGAILGKVTVQQLLFLSFFEVFFYSLNYFVGVYKLQAIDVGGSMFIHTFGAYFGVSATIFLSKKEAWDHINISSEYRSDLTSMIGTLFLWLYWPSFNAALAGPRQFRVVINTTLSLVGACMGAFIGSKMCRGLKFDMVDIQNATLAGGVAVGSSADLVIEPGSAILIGTLAGFISSFCFKFLTPALAKIGIHDTCGVHNLHGIPGLIGAISSIIAAANTSRSDFVTQEEYDTYFPRKGDQPAYQAAALGATLGIAITSGLLCGWFVSKITHSPPEEAIADDSLQWEMTDGFITKWDLEGMSRTSRGTSSTTVTQRVHPSSEARPSSFAQAETPNSPQPLLPSVPHMEEEGSQEGV